MALQTSCQSGVRLMCSSLEPKICQKNKKVKNIQLLAQKMEPRPSNFMDMIIGNRSKWYMHVERNDCIRQLSDSTNQQKNNIIDYQVWVKIALAQPTQIKFHFKQVGSTIHILFFHSAHSKAIFSTSSKTNKLFYIHKILNLIIQKLSFS